MDPGLFSVVFSIVGAGLKPAPTNPHAHCYRLNETSRLCLCSRFLLLRRLDLIEIL